MDIVERILGILQEKGLKQKELTDYLGINESAIANWKKGKVKSYMRYISEIATFLEVSVDYLLGNEEISQNNVVNSGSSNTIQNGNNNVIELRAEGALTINNPAVAEAYESLTEREKLSVQMFILDTAEAKKKEKEKKD